MEKQIKIIQDEPFKTDKVYTASNYLLMARIPRAKSKKSSFYILSDDINVTVNQDGIPYCIETLFPKRTWKLSRDIIPQASVITGKIGFLGPQDYDNWYEDEFIAFTVEDYHTVLIKSKDRNLEKGVRISPRITVYLDSNNDFSSLLLTHIEFKD